MMARDPVPVRWTFLTNHAHVLLCLARSPALRLRDVAIEVGVTERAVQRIVADLEEGRYLTRRRAGRQNAYEINREGPMRHPVEAHATVQTLIDIVMGHGAPGAAAPGRRPASHRSASRRRAS